MWLTQEKRFLILKDFGLKRAKKETPTFIAKSVAELARASVVRKQWADRLRQRAEAAAEKVGRVAKKGGFSDEAVQAIRREILGVAG